MIEFVSAMRVAFLLALVGCYSPGYRDCEVTCGGGTCPSGFVCDRGVCRVEGFSGACGVTIDAAIDSPPNADDDGDGIINKDDNCSKVANPQQENEDRDARGDACDPCPVDGAAGADDDPDMDGVGVGCDPEPDQQNRIDVFEGFNGPMALSTATFTGTWSTSNGQAKSNNSGPAMSGISWPEPMSNVVMVSAQFTMDNFDPTSPLIYIGVAHHIGGSNPVRCSLNALNPQQLELAANNQRLTGVPTTVNVGDTAVTYSKRDGVDFECSEAIKDLHITGSIPGTSGTGQTGLVATGVNATVSWVIIVSRVP